LALLIAARPAYAVPWFPFGPDGGDARAFAADPRDPNHIYLGTATGWIYQSVDGGRKWARLASVGMRNDLVLDNIVVDPADPKHLVVGGWVASDLKHPDGGIFISQDGGVKWTPQVDMHGQSVLALTVAPSDAKIMVAGTMEGVFRSTDSGAHWAAISSKGDKELHEVESIAIDPVDPNVIYAGTWHLPWKTTDGGHTWKNMKQGIIEDSDVFSIIVDPKQPNVVYLSACSGIYKSEDGGAKFTGGVGQNKAQGIPSTARRTRVLMQDPKNLQTVFAGTTEGLYRSVDGGKSWLQTTGPEVIVNDVYVDPADTTRVLLATDRGGVLASNDGGASFLPSNSGFSTRQITAYTADAEHPATLYVGVVNDKEWGGVFVSRTGGLSWAQLSAGLDGRDVFALGQAPDGTIVAGTSHGIYRLKDAVWQRAGDVSSGAKPFVARKASAAKAGVAHATGKARVGAAGGTGAAVKGFDGSVYGFALSGETLFAATSQGLLRSASSGLTWNVASTILVDEYRFLAAARGNLLAASLSAAELSNDGGDHWQAVALPPGVTQVSAAAVDGQGRVWVAGRDGVFYSTNKGASWQTPPGLYVRNASCLYYDEAKDRVLVTSGGLGTQAFAVQLPGMQVTTWDTGWNLRFVRPVGSYLVAGTLFDGIVVQPKMVDSPGPEAEKAAR
jgi:ligand-binding sensor domain-containing protein